MNKKHFYAAVILFSLLVAGIQPALAIVIPGDTSYYDYDGLYTYTLNQDVFETITIMSNGIILDGNGHTISGIASGCGVDLSERSGVTIQNLKVTGCGSGIHLGSSDNCIITGNTVSNNGTNGISLCASSSNTITGNVITGAPSSTGIHLYQYSSGNTVSGNNVSNTSIGISISTYCTGNTVSGNNVSGSNDGIKIYMHSTNNTLTNNTASSNTRYAIFLHFADNNILEYNTAKDNIGGIGFYLNASNGNTLRNNTSSTNTVLDSQGGHGIRLYDCVNNQIYNNSFIDNTTQASVSGGSGNVFDLNGSGNYWSNWCPPEHPDTDPADGIVDEPYVFTGGQDNYPLAPTPEQALGKLIIKVEDINGEYGISNALDSKLENALAALEAKNAGQRQDAINKMQAFINAVEAQRDNKIPADVADGLIADANYIISLL